MLGGICSECSILVVELIVLRIIKAEALRLLAKADLLSLIHERRRLMLLFGQLTVQVFLMRCLILAMALVLDAFERASLRID